MYCSATTTNRLQQYIFWYKAYCSILSYDQIIFQPWGALAIHRRMIVRNNERRAKGFRNIRARLETTNEETSAKREHILTYDFFALKGDIEVYFFTAFVHSDITFHVDTYSKFDNISIEHFQSHLSLKCRL